MSIPNELASEIAVAIITREAKNPERLEKMKELILKVHSTLRSAEAEADQKLRRAQRASASDQLKPVS